MGGKWCEKNRVQESSPPSVLLPRTPLYPPAFLHSCPPHPLPSCLGLLFTLLSPCTVILPALCPLVWDTSSPSCPLAQLFSPPYALLSRTPLHPPAFLLSCPPCPLPSWNLHRVSRVYQNCQKCSYGVHQLESTVS